MIEGNWISRLRPGRAALGVFILAALCAGLVVWQFERERVALAGAEVQALAYDHACALSNAVRASAAVAAALGVMLREHRGDLPHFEDVAENLLPFFPSITAVYLLPDGVVGAVHPRAKNTKALGVNVFTDPERAADARRSRETGELMVTGPVALPEGGLGMVGRLPVYLDEPDGGQRFWGFVSAILPLPRLLREAGLDDLRARGIDYKLWSSQPPDDAPIIIAESGPTPLRAPVERQLSFPQPGWTLSLSPRDGWGSPAQIVGKGALGLAFSLLLATLSRLWLEVRQRASDLERQLVARAADLARAEAVAQVGSWAYDLATDRTTYSAVARRIVALDDEPNGYQTFLTRVHPADRERVDQAWQAALRGVPYDVEHRCLINGEKRWLRQRAVLTFDAAGQPLRARGTVEDITERKVSEIALRESAGRVRSIIETTQEGVWVLDPQGLTLYANARMAQMLDCTVDDLRGQSFLEFMDKDMRASALENLARRAAGIAETHEFRLRRRDGAPLWVLIATNPLQDTDGQYIGALGLLTDITERKLAEEEIRRLAFYDALTGLPNRRLLLDRLHQALTASQRQGNHGAVLLLDLDHFKEVNDSFGHDGGDVLLQQVAGRLQATVREEDSSARLGGDEFVVLLQGLSGDPARAADQAAAVGHKLLVAIAAPYALTAGVGRVTPSIGITLFDGSKAQADLDALLQEADRAMYQAKDHGRNRVCFYDSLRHQSVSAHTALRAALRAAIEDDQLNLVYQPQVDAAGQITGAEALLRWDTADGATHQARDLIAAAEAGGLAQPLGRWVLGRACAQLKAWAEAPETANLDLSVNISPTHFGHPDLVADVRSALAETGANPSRLRLELTESPLLLDLEESRTRLTALQALGVRLTLDNFGAGYCSLACIGGLPIDRLKLTSAFVKGLLGGAEEQAVAGHFVAFARGLGLEIMAEGVETEAQRAYLLGQGVRAFQGYLFAPPGPAAAVLAATQGPPGAG